MSTLAFPTLTIRPQRMDWTWNANNQAQASPYSRSVATQETPGAVWSTVLDFSHARGANARILWAFLQKMNGRAGRVAVPFFGYDRPAGIGGGSPLVAGAAQSGKTLTVDGGPTSVAGWLLAGDMFTVGEFIYRLTADAATDAGGAASLAFGPALRSTPADNAPLTLIRPTTRMMFVDDRQGSTFAPGGFNPFIFTMQEALQ